MTTAGIELGPEPDRGPRGGLGFVCRVARTSAERAGYFALRRAIFCTEQGLFAGDDRDEIDDGAVPIVCVTTRADATGGGGATGGGDTTGGGGNDDTGRVVGVVRVWEEAPGDYWGGRLGVDRDFRAVGAIGKWLIQTAVGSARAWGAWRFRATVQRPNVPLFRRLHWRSLADVEIVGQPHHLMEADLDRYVPTNERRPSDALSPSDGAPTRRGADAA